MARRFDVQPATIAKELGSTFRRMGNVDGATLYTGKAVAGEFKRLLQKVGVDAERGDPLELGPNGARIEFVRDDDPYSFACTKWEALIDNVRAVQRTIANLYAVYEDYGAVGEATGGQPMPGRAAPTEREAFRAVFALGSGEKRRPGWADVLHIAPDANSAEIRLAFRRLAMLHHPDRGGDRAAWDKIERAQREALAELEARAAGVAAAAAR